MIRLLSIALPDLATDRVRRNHEEAIRELQKVSSANAKILPNVILKDGANTLVAHGLSRAASFVITSVPRGAVSTGRITEVRDGTVDRDHFVMLRADDWGATITVDIEVR